MPLFDTRDPNSTVHAEWEAQQARKKSGRVPTTPVSIFWAVFGALWAFALSAGVIYALIRMVN
jgi:hypothetical protein